MTVVEADKTLPKTCFNLIFCMVRCRLKVRTSVSKTDDDRSIRSAAAKKYLSSFLYLDEPE